MGSKIIDLSQEIYQGMPVFPPHQPTMIFPNISHEESLKRSGFMFATNNLLISEHGPTHTDAPYEYDPQGDTIDRVDLSRFFGPAYGLDVSHVSPDDFITRHDIETALARHGFTLARGDIIMLYTGHYQRAYGTPAWLDRYTGLDMAAAEFLAQSGVGMVGVDSPSIDKTGDDNFCGHTVCRRSGMLNTENMCNLDKVAGKRFLYIGFPLKIRNGTGSPVRAIAVLNEGENQ
ncbi:cyclase family protein [Brenneria sp. 4F2]|nr:cyclase family protein [Brenneria bubanii]